MSISSEINRISQNVSDSLTAVASKGATVPSGANSDDLPDLISSLPSTNTVTYNLTGGASASVTPSKVIAGQGFSVKLNAPTGYNLNNVTVTMGGNDITSQVFTPDEAGGGGANLQTKSVSYTPTTSTQSETVTPDSGYDGMSSVGVSVGAIPSEYIIPSGSQTITTNNTYDVTSLAEVVVNVTGGGSSVATGTVTSSSASTTISFDTGLSTITGILVMPINTPLTGSRTQAAMICLPNGSFYKAISIHTNSGGTGWVSPSVYTSNKFTLSGTTVTVTGAYSFRPAVGYIWYAW